MERLLMSTGSRSFSFDSQVALIEFRSVGFCGGRKTNKKNPEKNPQKKARTNNKLNCL